jgi:hypothetical protein
MGRLDSANPPPHTPAVACFSRFRTCSAHSPFPLSPPGKDVVVSRSPLSGVLNLLTHVVLALSLSVALSVLLWSGSGFGA